MEKLRKRIHDNSNGLDYVLVGDYYIPDLKLAEENRPTGQWGRMHNRCTTAYFIPPTNGAKAVQRYRLGGFFSTCASSLGAYNTAVVWFCPAYYLGF